MADSRLPKLMLSGQAAGEKTFRGKARIVWTDVLLSDVRKRKLNHHNRDAQNRPVWRELTCVACT